MRPSRSFGAPYELCREAGRSHGSFSWRSFPFLPTYRIPPPGLSFPPSSRRIRGHEPAVVPHELHLRHPVPFRELVVGGRRTRIGRAVERRGLGLDHGGQPELQRPHREVDQVRAHVAERALAPVHPAAPVERVVNRVVRHLGRDAEKQIPRQALGHGVRPVHRRRDALGQAAVVPADASRIPRQRRRPRDPLRPEPERPVRPHVHFADLADGARP